MSSMMKRVLITGGCGFIGLHLARRLASEARTEVVLVDNFVRGRRDEDLSALLELSNVTLIEGDLTDPLTLKKLGDGYDEVYHLAAILGVRNVIDRPHEVLRINAVATLNLLDWYVRGGGKRLLFSSTSEVYAWAMGMTTIPIPTPEAVPLVMTDLDAPRSTYAGSKIFGELSVRQYCNKFQKPYVIVRYHNVYGPRMGNEHVIPQLYARVRDGQNPLTVYSADHRRAFCYVSDAIDATVLAMRTPQAHGMTINVGNDNEEVSIDELARKLIACAGINRDIKPEHDAADPIQRRCPDESVARKALGYSPKVSLEDGLTLTLEWYGKEYDKRNH
jgi:UDP-glucose 4-epimerase